MPRGARKAIRLVALAVLFAAVAAPSIADAASVAYVDNGEVWLASLDGAKKARLATTVVNANGDTEKWLDVAQSDGGRIVAVRNKPGRISNFSWFKIWEPDGTSTVEGPLNAPGGWSCTSIRSASTSPRTGSTSSTATRTRAAAARSRSASGTYIRPATNSTLAPIDTSGETHPSLFGSRMIALEGSCPKSSTSRTRAPATPTRTLHPVARHHGRRPRPRGRRRRGHRAPGGARVRAWNGGTQTVGKIGVHRDPGVDQVPTFRPPWTASCPRQASRGTRRSRRTPGRSRGRTTAA